MMEKIQAWIEKHLVPVINKITSNFWFGIVADAVLFIVPFSMVSAIPSLWAILRRFVPVLPDISPLSTFSFGLIGLFVVFVIPYNCLQKIEKKDRSMIAGFTGIGAYMMCMNFQTVDGGSLVSMNKFGAGGMFTAMVVGLMVAVIYKLLAKYSFFGEDSVIPDFVKNWFDNIAAILISLTIAYLFTYVAKIDVFAMVQVLMKPVTSFAQSAPGVIMIVFLQNVFYFFGVSGWVFTPVTRTITQAAIAENAELVAAGLAPKNIYAYGFSRYHHIGGVRRYPSAGTVHAACKIQEVPSAGQGYAGALHLQHQRAFAVRCSRRQPLYADPHRAHRHHPARLLLPVVRHGLGHHQLRQLRYELCPQRRICFLHVRRRLAQRSADLHQLCAGCADLVSVL